MTTATDRVPGMGSVLLSYVAQYLTVAALLAAFLTLRSNLLSYALLDPYSLGSAANFGLFAFCAVFGLWMVVPGIFNRSLARMRYGISRLVCDIGLVVVGLVTALVWLLLITLPHSVLRGHLSDQTILLGAIVWLPLYVYAFLFPAAAFRRHDRTSAPAGGYVRREPMVSRTLGIANADTWEQEKPHLLLRILGVPPFIALILGIFGWSHPLWLPSAELQSILTEHSYEILIGFAGVGAVGGWIASGRRGGSQSKRITQKVLGSVIVGALCASIANPAIRVGLPYAASFLMATTPASDEVVVVSRGHAHRRRSCDHTATVALPRNRSATFSICNVPPDLWQTLQAGDRLVLDGPGTRFGIRYNRIAPAK